MEDPLYKWKTLYAAPQAQQPGWEHAANEWSDATTNAIQHLRNIHEGITTAAEALANMEPCFRHCTPVSDAARKGGA